ncbi:DUF6035 family protein [Mesorhizobium onobrychidis]|uniref:DUF6035 domain-containing protein n=1 Tax=Mesorhizobium onobrychidis TaxID=2775404 RepID=A0ABY5QVS1_9HYPH|nr:hypothetical protein [Mesorhizobium onobrychidis]UVC15320.1 hypothetical protein IHQ72_33205 [Mesorhizobium onobrychidis]
MSPEEIPLLQRTVKGALILPAPGVVSSDTLVAMPEIEWRALRNSITDGHNGRVGGLEARCMFPGCNGLVFISERVKGNTRFPLFAHRKGEGMGCPWHQRAKLTPDEARGAQYQGNQVSPAHEFICRELDRLVRMDERFESAEIDRTYVAPSGDGHGRYPDVRFKWRGLPESVLEVQLSNTFQPEISERGIFYEKKKMPLIWILHGVEPKLSNLPSSYRDVILRHKQNAFALDAEAIQASEQGRTLILKCFLLDKAGSVTETQLVRFDSLTFPEMGLPYYRNLLLPDLEAIRARRHPWVAALKALKAKTDGNWYASSMGIDQVEAAFNALPDPPRTREDRYDFARMIAIVLTLLFEATDKYQDLVYNDLANATAALNAFLSRGGSQQAVASIVETLITRSVLSQKLKPSVHNHIKKAKAAEPVQIELGHPFFAMLAWLVPEIFDEAVREELALADALPTWAVA